MSDYPYVSRNLALKLLRIVTPLLFMAHAVVRIGPPGTIDQFALFMGNLGFPAPVAVVWAITLVELVAGTMLIAGIKVRWAASALAAIAAGGIVLIHAHLGWFVGEHGTGGSEYSVALLVMLLVIAAHDPQRTDS
ncbi:DoxX family protein [Novosphingobium sp.]|uniref:DoxX family protein n=1 Tax=Novosphingobium sp. TaxID=1874826 RepID=UPI0025E4D35A|nr:DoxX family protein [Novosphingobium sp.]MCC6925780.1 DoxX family protein [Novosphingobium sp.]